MKGNKLKINVYGESIRYKRIELSAEQQVNFELVAKSLGQSLEESLLDPYFYYKLKIANIQSVDDLKGESWNGIINTPKNQIKIWYQGKKVQKLNINDLIELMLFPLYNTHHTISDFLSVPSLYIEQKSIGLVASFEVQVEDFNIDLLEFHLSVINRKNYKIEFNYPKYTFKNAKIDSLITAQHCFYI